MIIKKHWRIVEIRKISKAIIILSVAVSILIILIKLKVINI